MAAPETRVAGGAPSQPSVVDALAHCRNHAAPFVSDSQRVLRFSGVQIAHHTGEQLYAGTADTGTVDVDYDFARTGNWFFDIDDGSVTWTENDERPHQRGVTTATAAVVVC